MLWWCPRQYSGRSDQVSDLNHRHQHLAGRIPWYRILELSSRVGYLKGLSSMTKRGDARACPEEGWSVVGSNVIGFVDSSANRFGNMANR